MTFPNILITGTPGVGKSRLCKELVERLGDNKYKWHNVSQVAKDNDCVAEYDEEYECPVLNEDKVGDVATFPADICMTNSRSPLQLLDLLEPQMAKGGNIVEYHGCDFFPERWFQLVFVIQCDNTILYDRLKKRNYKEKKIKENIECEIFHTILEEAQDSYDEEIVHALKNENSEDRTAALEKMQELIAEEEKNPRKKEDKGEKEESSDDMEGSGDDDEEGGSESD